MTAWVLGLAWSLVVVGASARRRPVPARVRALAPATPHQRRRGGGLDLAVAAGGLTHRRGALEQVAPEVVRRRGRALLAAAAVAPFAWPLAPVAALVVGVVAPRLAARRQRVRRAAEVEASLPDVVDLLLLAVDAGLNVPLALEAVCRRGTGPVVDALSVALDETHLGRRLADALDGVPARLEGGDAVRPLVAALVASDRYGAPLGPGLVRLADDARHLRRRRAEEAARRLPVTLLFPLVCCTLPAFGLLTVAPLIASAVRSLRL